MASIIYSGANYGAQVGHNYGAITANFYHLPDIMTIRSLVRSLHRSLSTSVDPFKQVQNELALLLTALEVADRPSTPIVGDMQSSIREELQECHKILKRLRVMKVEYDSKESNVTGCRDLDDESVEQLAEIRRQLSSCTATLSFININSIRSSQEHVEEMLKKFLQNANNRKRARTIISSRSISSDEGDNWRQLRKELETAGIGPEAFSENLDLIIAIFKRSGFSDDMPNLDSITQHAIDSEPERLPLPEVKRKPMSTVSTSEQKSVTSFQRQLYSVWQMSPLRIDAMISKAFGRRDDLASCAEDGDLLSIMAKLDQGADINSSNRAGDSALALAAARGHKEIVLLLFTKGANVRAMNLKRETALVQAAKNGRNEILNILLSHSESMDDSQCQMALGTAAEHGHEGIVKILLDHGVDANQIDRNNDQDNTALFKAAANGHDSLVLLLLNHGVRTDTLNYWGESAMFAACRSNREMIARRLLRHGAKFDSKAKDAALRHYGLFGVLSGDESMMRGY